MTSIRQVSTLCIDNFVRNNPECVRESKLIQKIALAALALFVTSTFLFAGMMAASNPQVISFSQWSGTQICFFSICVTGIFTSLITFLFFNIIESSKRTMPTI